MKITGTQKVILSAIILVVVLALTAAVVAFTGAPRPNALFTGSGKLSGPELPKLSFESYPTQEEEKELSEITARLEASYGKLPGYASALTPFYEDSIRRILSAHNGQNQVYSPLNLYMALSMAAEISGGNTRGQILDLLGAPDVETLREQSGDIWLMSSLGYYGCETDLGNSVWLSNSIDYKQETLDILADSHFAETFRGSPGTEEYNELLREWTNEKTHSLLEESVNNLEMDPATVMTLMSTVYFKASWHDKFPEDLTARETFHAPEGDTECDFMHRRFSGSYFRGEHFGAAAVYFSGGGNMLFILPDEDSGIDRLLAEDSDLWDFLHWRLAFGADHGTPDWRDEEGAKINLALPKFDVSSERELTEDLTALGMTDAFDPFVSDFDPLTKSEMPLFISEVNHAARVMVDEEGCTAASYVEIMAEAMGAVGLPEKEIDFTLDRPFIFLIETGEGMPLFAGVVNHP